VIPVRIDGPGGPLHLSQILYSVHDRFLITPSAGTNWHLLPHQRRRGSVIDHMSRWLAEVPGNTGAWWLLHACTAVPQAARPQFNVFVAALKTYNHFAIAANLRLVRERVREFMKAIPKEAAP
jgi:hypothetical protein